ncbi:hypothetical protein A7L09_18700 [Acinetobacter nosocomialis]|nr:hypothetical protein A7L09_18700 [Acinetobacter nosocomialis]
MGVDGTGHAILHLGIQLWKSIIVIDTSFLDISDSSLLNNVPHEKPLDCLILGAALAAVGTADELDVAAAVLVAAPVPALERHG